MDRKQTLYHVTSRQAAAAIANEGFHGDWGDVGFGVYLYDDLDSAAIYASSGGWDGSLEDAVILALEADPMEIEGIIPDPHWPNPEDYEHVQFHPMDPDDPAPWRVDLQVLEPDHFSQLAPGPSARAGDNEMTGPGPDL